MSLTAGRVVGDGAECGNPEVLCFSPCPSVLLPLRYQSGHAVCLRYRSELVPSVYGVRYVSHLLQLECFASAVAIEHAKDDRLLRIAK